MFRLLGAVTAYRLAVFSAAAAICMLCALQRSCAGSITSVLPRTVRDSCEEVIEISIKLCKLVGTPIFKAAGPRIRELNTQIFKQIRRPLFRYGVRYTDARDVFISILAFTAACLARVPRSLRPLP